MSTGSSTGWSNTFSTAMTFDAGVILNAGIKDYAGNTGTAGQVLSSTGSSDVEWVSLSEIQGVDGSGTANYIPIWTDTDTLGNSVIYQTGSNIGIGTLSPGAYKLNVFGDFKFNSDGSGYMQSEYGDHKISIYDGSNNEIVSFQDLDGNSANQLVVTSNGVGIGTASPSYKLHVVSNVTPMAKFEGTTNAYVDFTDPSSSVRLQNSGHSYFGTQTNTDLNFKTNATVKMTIQNSGNVGINTTSPTTKLQISASNASSPTANIFLDIDGANTPGMGGEIIFGTSTSGTLTNYNAKIQGKRSALDNGSSDIHFQTTHVATAITPSTKMYIKSDGNVGIGTTSPLTQKM